MSRGGGQRLVGSNRRREPGKQNDRQPQQASAGSSCRHGTASGNASGEAHDYSFLTAQEGVE
jgi:hypothetical protein